MDYQNLRDGYCIKTNENVQEILQAITPLCKYADNKDIRKAPSVVKMYDYWKTKIIAALILKENTVIGFAIIFEAKKWLNLVELYVVQDEREKGFGKALFDFVENIAKEKAKQKIKWKCAINSDANAFYDTVGFTTKTEKEQEFSYEKVLVSVA